MRTLPPPGRRALVYLLTLLGLGMLIPLTHTQAQEPPPPHLGYGVSVRQMSSLDSLFAPLGVEWVKLWEEYEPGPPTERLPYQVLFAIRCAGPPGDLDAWGEHVAALAQAGRGYVEAYEVCNEPNLAIFWDNAPPDPAQYVQMLRVAHERIKAVDPGAIVVSAGLAPTGRITDTCNDWDGNNCWAMDEREYARQMFLHGAGEYFDAFGYHPYGFAYAPETDAAAVSNGFAFRGAEVMHDLLVAYGLGDKPLWATEFNWLRDWREDGDLPSACQEDYEATFGWMEVSGVQQANYITRAYRYADEHWPWMGGMLVWNLDWHTYHYNWDCNAAHARYFALRRYTPGNDDGAPTLAYDALAAMEKRPGFFGPRLTVAPESLSLRAVRGVSRAVTGTLLIGNDGYRVLTWTATISPGDITPTLAVTGGRQGEPLTVTVSTSGCRTGLFHGGLVITATSDGHGGVADAPRYVPISLTVVEPTPRLVVEPPVLAFTASVERAGPVTGAVRVLNGGWGAFTWTARVVSGLWPSGTGSLGVQITPTLAVTAGRPGDPLTVTLDTTGYRPGFYVAAIQVGTIPSTVLDAPQTLPLTLRVWAESRAVYLPLVLRGRD